MMDGKPHILLVRARKDPSRWIFPKGHIEAGESPDIAALREAREESGVEGVVLGPVAALEFESGDEPVRVQYYLIAAATPGEPREGREQLWALPWKAMSDLAFDDARAVLYQALRQIDRYQAQLNGPPAADPTFESFLLAEYAHSGESLLQNEEHGEKRAAFFLTLSGVVVTILPLLLGKDAVLRPDRRQPLVIVSLLILIVLANVTLARIVARDAASDRFKKGLNRIRRYFVPRADDPRLLFVAFDAHKDEGRAPWDWRSVGKGGWVVTVALVEAMLLGALAAAVAATRWSWCNVTVGIVTSLLSWCGLIKLANWRYSKV
jgi:diadenosine hexaphosphate hydrolase (ATP-forming)